MAFLPPPLLPFYLSPFLPFSNSSRRPSAEVALLAQLGHRYLRYRKFGGTIIEQIGQDCVVTKCLRCEAPLPYFVYRLPLIVPEPLICNRISLCQTPQRFRQPKEALT